jgi:hypothetical protein
MSFSTAAFTPADERLQPPAIRALFESSRARRWSALLDRIAAGDLDACGTFYDESSQLAFSLIMQIVQDRDRAEDAMVDLYVDIRNRAQRGEHRERSPLPWLIALARDAAAPRPLPIRPAPVACRVIPFEVAGWLGHWVAG